jgi:hypothetical protein
MCSVPNGCSASTHTDWEHVKIPRRPKGHGDRAESARQGVERSRLLGRQARRPLTALVSYRGGAECWIEVRARGRIYRFPGWVSAYDVVMALNEGSP